MNPDTNSSKSGLDKLQSIVVQFLCSNGQESARYARRARTRQEKSSVGQLYPESYRSERKKESKMCAVCIPDGSAEVLGRLETQHRDTCLAATRSLFSPLTSQPLSFHILINSPPANSFDSHTSEKPRIYVKTMGFKPFRDTYLQSAISQTLLNHILTKNRGWGWRAIFASPIPSRGDGIRVTNHESTSHESRSESRPVHKAVVNVLGRALECSGRSVLPLCEERW